MDWSFFRIAAVLFIFLVVIEVNSEFRVQVRDYNTKNGTIKWHSIRRQKREWIKFAAACREGEDNSKRNPIAKIHSDCAANQQVTYRISGVGIDQPPYGIFVINQKTGEINITSIVDREVTPFFIIYCRALNSMGQDLERPLELRVRVLDINDNPPVFSMSTFVGQIEENSNANTLVMILNATDADEPNNLNSKIAFKIIRQEPADAPMFIINRYTGEIRTMNNFLDREQYGQYSLAVRGSDRDGGADGMSAECECSIKILDVNDNIPYLVLPEISIKIEENTLYTNLMEIRVIDLDEEFSANWMGVIFFISGNEGNWFDIEMNERTNVGILKVVKPLDYEAVNNLQLSIGVRNKAEFHHSIMSQYKLTATAISVAVLNQREGPVFRPGSKTYIVTGNMGANSKVGDFIATDQDTNGPSTTARYVMGNNPADLLAVDSRTGIITLKNKVTRDQYNMLGGKYQGTILSIDDDLQRTCTGTININMEGFDFSHSDTTTNAGGNTDDNTNTNTGSNTNASRDDTSTQQGSNTNTLEGPNGIAVISDNVHFGPAGIGLLIMGFLVLGLVPFLMICCDCDGAATRSVGGFEPVPECSDGAMHVWSEEGPQLDPTNTVCVPPISGATNLIEFVDNSGVYTNEYDGRKMHDLGGGERVELREEVNMSGMPETCQEYSGTLRRNSMRECREGGLNMNFMESYFCQKAYAYADEDEGRPANDCLLIYDHEGVGSPVGSIGCCSWIVDDLDESCMETLDPKFRTLAEICLDTEIEPFPSHQACIPISTDLPLLGPHYFVSESSGLTPSEAEFQEEMAASEPVIHGDIIVTETYGAADQCVQPTTIIFDPQLAPNVVVTETLMAPVYDIQGNICVPAELADYNNVIYAERVLASPGVPDMSNSSTTDGCMGPVMSGSVLVGPEIQVMQMMSPDIPISQTIGSTSPMTPRHRVTRYSNIHYTQQ
uniref:Desmoglein 1 n=1 Tax=Saimiri boliviensis boliviensis TaxID=39432 RepID=A0A2K6TVY9_SAIBB